MIARHTGYKPGVFTHVVANEQIYDRHFEVADEMLDRYIAKYEQYLKDKENPDYVRPAKPMLVLNPDATNFFEMTIDDFIMENYEPMKPQLKLELGI